MPIDCGDPKNPADRLPDSISTPEGDIGDDSASPFPSTDEDLEIPPGSAPSPYEADKKPKGLEKFVDEVVRGEYM
jgi:hypothetical protein